MKECAQGEEDIPCLQPFRALELLDPSSIMRSSPKFLINGLFWMKANNATDIDNAIQQLIHLPSAVSDELWRELQTLLHRKIKQKHGNEASEPDIFAPLLYIFKYNNNSDTMALISFRKAVLHCIMEAVLSIVKDCKDLTDRTTRENRLYRLMGLLTVLHECLALFGETLKKAENSEVLGGFGGLVAAYRSWLLSRLGK
ncbi:hypothetical protein EON65_54765 [archaeon]|nr:MAG: hypothetical protein EON65_54765 [archaeon]